MSENFTNVHPFGVNASDVAAAVEDHFRRHPQSAPASPSVVNTVHTIEHLEVKAPKELPSNGQSGMVLGFTSDGPTWVTPEKGPEPTPAYDDTLVKESVKDLLSRIATLEESLKVNNQEKQSLIDAQQKWFADKHPDCFLEYADGRRLFRPELLSIKHDALLTEIYNRPVPVQIVEKEHHHHHHPRWPTYVAMAAMLALREVVRYVWNV